MKVGDLVRDSETLDIGILVEIDFRPERFNILGYMEPYLVLNMDGEAHWFSEGYIEGCCEVISESR
jgi:hypothetical protein